MEKAQFRIMNKKRDGEKVYLWCILNDFLDGFRATDEDKAKAKKNGLTEFFELYDDDDIKYYSGYMNTDNLEDNNRDEFTILNHYMNDVGCTYMKYRSQRTGKMEHL